MQHFERLASAFGRKGKAISPKLGPLFSPDHFHQLEFAHRGGSAYGPENTLALIAYNIETLGVNALEIDLRLTKDGYLVLFHDDRIARLLDAPFDAPVQALTLAELKAYPLRDKRLGEVFVTAFSEFLRSYCHWVGAEGRGLMCELDIKARGDEAPAVVAALLRELDAADAHCDGRLRDHVFVSSFYPAILAEIRQHSDQIVLAFSVNRNSPEDWWMARIAALAAYFVACRYDCAIIQPNTGWVSAFFVRRWRDRGRLINTFTANTAEDKQFVSKFAIAYTTNCPNGFCENDASDLMRPRNSWWSRIAG